MAKLFKFEKELRAILDIFEVVAPYGMSYDNPYNIIEFSYSLKNSKLNNVKYEFFIFDGKDYCFYIYEIGKRSYSGLIYSSDYTAISSIFLNFIEINS